MRTAIETPQIVHRIHFLRTAWFRNPPSRSTLRWAKYAAAILIFLSVGAYLYFNSRPVLREQTVAVSSVEHNVVPGGSKATLTLTDGSIILLDSAANGELALQEIQK